MAPRKNYKTDEERLQAILQSKNKYMLNTVWRCEFCKKEMKRCAVTTHKKRKNIN